MTFFKDNNLRIKKIAAGGRHNLVLCDNNKIYAFGDNSQNQCSGLNIFYNQPYLITKECEMNVLDIFAGYDFSACYSTQQGLLCWGNNSNYKYGTDIDEKGSHVPIFTNDLLGLNIGEVYTGVNNMVVILSDFSNSILNKK